VKIVERLTKGESKKKKRNKSHEASYMVVEVGGTSTFVTHDVTKVEVRWAETHLKLKSHAPKERGHLNRWFHYLNCRPGQHIENRFYIKLHPWELGLLQGCVLLATRW
jgi:hypothetical protein